MVAEQKDQIYEVRYRQQSDFAGHISSTKCLVDSTCFEGKEGKESQVRCMCIIWRLGGCQHSVGEVLQNAGFLRFLLGVD